MARRVIEVTKVIVEPGNKLEIIYVPEQTQILQAGKQYRFVLAVNEHVKEVNTNGS